MIVDIYPPRHGGVNVHDVGRERGMDVVGRSQEAYDRFSEAVEVPLTVLAVGWLPVLVVPLAVRVSQGTSDVLDGMDYLVKLYLSPSRWQFFRRHLVDLAVIAVPVLRPLRALRLLRLLRLVTLGR